jgi:hypothetical protein
LRTSPVNNAETAGNGNMFFQDGDQSKKEKKIPRHGPKPISIICHLSSTPTFSFIPAFKVKKKIRGKYFLSSAKIHGRVLNLVKNSSRLLPSFSGIHIYSPCREIYELFRNKFLE